MQNQERFEALRALTPIDAVQAWLDGDFGIEDQPALIAAIRKDPRVSLSEPFAKRYTTAWMLRRAWSVSPVRDSLLS